ncbi:MAG: succinate dehydrogenase [Geodermatophilaceae bacterium]|nr:succinate dehydrogenase [Geodermatophilaceae bacterium]
MSHEVVQLTRRRFGETMRRDAWWVPPIGVFVVLSSFLAYATWAAFQNANFAFGPYLSPFYSPLFFGDSPHAWFGASPRWLPATSPALLILPFPAGFRFTCYYYRGAYYKAFWADPPSCSVGEPRNSYLGERSLPLVLQNVHRYFLYFAIVFIGILAYDAWHAYQFADASGGTKFGIGIGSLVLTVNVCLLSGYTLGCHSLRHLVGGYLDRMAGRPVRRTAYQCVSCLNRGHMNWAWASLFWVAFSDIYVRLCAMGIWHDVRIL